MIKLTPVSVDTVQSELAKYIAIHLIRDNVVAMSALPMAISIMGAIQDALDKDNLRAAINYFKQSWKESDRWWVKYHPDSSIAKEIKKGTRAGMNYYRKKRKKKAK
jgi:hypothetical protein